MLSKGKVEFGSQERTWKDRKEGNKGGQKTAMNDSNDLGVWIELDCPDQLLRYMESPSMIFHLLLKHKDQDDQAR